MPSPQSSPLLHKKQTDQFSHFETTHWFWTNFKVLFIIITITGIPESVIMGASCPHTNKKHDHIFLTKNTFSIRTQNTICRIHSCLVSTSIC